jgi:hypothetical protein
MKCIIYKKVNKINIKHNNNKSLNKNNKKNNYNNNMS